MPLVLSAQNLVPNPDFEVYSSCPSSSGQLDSALHWINPTPGGFPNGNADYFHTCSADMGVPVNFAGTQPAHSGLAYGGFEPYANTIPNYREYLEVPLMEPLVAGKCYQLDFYVSLGDKMQKAICNVGALFSDSLITQDTPGPLPFAPSLDGLGGCLTNAASWTLASGVYLAQGGESYLIIGNFHNDAATTTITVNPMAAYFYSFYYVDDVSLVMIPDDGCLPMGVEKPSVPFASLFPNPVGDHLSIITDGSEQVTFSIRDTWGRVVAQDRFTGSITIDVGHLAAGLYTAEITNGSGIVERQRFIKQ